MAFSNGQLVTASDLNNFSVTTVTTSGAGVIGTSLGVTTLLTVSGFGTHAFSAGGTGANQLDLRNTTAGTGNSALIRLGNDAAANICEFRVLSSTYTPAGNLHANGVTLERAAIGGLSLAATNSSGTVRFYAAGTTEVGRWDLTSSLQIGGTAARSGTAGTKRLDIFNGTAPTGTLTNGISLYSAAGELLVMDAAGNATPLSPHDHSPDWVFQCENKVTGKYVRIETEKLLKRLNELFGEPEWVQERSTEP